MARTWGFHNRGVAKRARSVRDVRRYHTADYLLATPLLADFLEEGLAQFGLSCEEFELGRM